MSMAESKIRNEAYEETLAAEWKLRGEAEARAWMAYSKVIAGIIRAFDAAMDRAYQVYNEAKEESK